MSFVNRFESADWRATFPPPCARDRSRRSPVVLVSSIKEVEEDKEEEEEEEDDDDVDDVDNGDGDVAV